ncbi:hypothetical protein KM043_011440 [Ampulex compressa]|nr:hypothetical protein KM043_011440 [Ampulex compressa]
MALSDLCRAMKKEKRPIYKGNECRGGPAVFCAVEESGLRKDSFGEVRRVIDRRSDRSDTPCNFLGSTPLSNSSPMIKSRPLAMSLCLWQVENRLNHIARRRTSTRAASGILTGTMHREMRFPIARN